MCFFSVKICKPIPVLTHYESENDHHMSPLRQIECWARASQKRLTMLDKKKICRSQTLYQHIVQITLNKCN